MQPYYQDDFATLYCGDTYKTLDALKPQADFLFADPPYNVGKKYGDFNDDDPHPVYVAKMQTIFDFGRAHAQSRMAFLVGHKRAQMFWSMLPDARLIVVKIGAIDTPNPDGYFHQYASLLVVGKPTWGKCIYDLWEGVRFPGEGYFFREQRYPHPGLTPQNLVLRVLNYFTLAGETVLDPFAGTGTTLAAAKQMGRKAIGIEQNHEYCAIAVERLQEASLFSHCPESLVTTQDSFLKEVVK